MWTSNVDSSSWPRPPGSRGDASPTGRARWRGGERRVSDGTRRRLIGSLRRLVAICHPAHDPARRRFDVLLHDRVAPVRDDLLEIATLLEQAVQPDPACVAELQRLLTDGCVSPLYNPEVHPSELRATLYYVRARLAEQTPPAPVGS